MLQVEELIDRLQTDYKHDKGEYQVPEEVPLFGAHVIEPHPSV